MVILWYFPFRGYKTKAPLPGGCAWFDWAVHERTGVSGLGVFNLYGSQNSILALILGFFQTVLETSKGWPFKRFLQRSLGKGTRRQRPHEHSLSK